MKYMLFAAVTLAAPFVWSDIAHYRILTRPEWDAIKNRPCVLMTMGFASSVVWGVAMLAEKFFPKVKANRNKAFAVALTLVMAQVSILIWGALKLHIREMFEVKAGELVVPKDGESYEEYVKRAARTESALHKN